MLTSVSAYHVRPVQVVCCVLLPVVCSICVPQLLSADADTDADACFLFGELFIVFSLIRSFTIR